MLQILVFIFPLDLPIEARLVGGSTPNKGRVEVYRNGYWGTICNDGWDVPDATVVCRMLGYSGAWAAGCCAEYRGGTGPIWLSELSCTGREKTLSECGHSGWGVNNCDHTNDAGVICHSPPTEKPVQPSSVKSSTTVMTSQSATTATTKPTSSVQESSSLNTWTVQISSIPATVSSITPIQTKLTSLVQTSSSLLPSTVQVSSLPTTTNMNSKAASLYKSFTVEVPSVISSTSSSMAVSSSITPTTPPGK